MFVVIDDEIESDEEKETVEVNCKKSKSEPSSSSLNSSTNSSRKDVEKEKKEMDSLELTIDSVARNFGTNDDQMSPVPLTAANSQQSPQVSKTNSPSLILLSSE